MRNATPPLPPSPPPLSISEEKVCYVIVKVRELDVKDAVTEPDPASNASDDGMIAILEDHGDDPVGDELRAFIENMNEDERIDLVALLWLGRGDGTLAEWAELREEAERADNGDTAPTWWASPWRPTTCRRRCPCSACPATNTTPAGCRTRREAVPPPYASPRAG